jgi:competence protein ComEA
MRDGRLVLKATQPVSVPNPPEYTISGWRARSARAVPAESPAAVGATVDAMPARTAAPPAESNPDAIDLNTATEDELASLPGIGPKLASEIARYRSHSPFTRVDDVMNVSGIGPKRLDAMRPFVTVK